MQKYIIIEVDEKKYLIVDFDKESDEWTLFPWEGDTDHDLTCSTQELNDFNIIDIVELPSFD